VRTFPSGGIGPARLKLTPNGKAGLGHSHAQQRSRCVRRGASPCPSANLNRSGFQRSVAVARFSARFCHAMDDSQVVQVDAEVGQILPRIATGAAPEGLTWVDKQ
jgi:hypothetical protein